MWRGFVLGWGALWPSWVLLSSTRFQGFLMKNKKIRPGHNEPPAFRKRRLNWDVWLMLSRTSDVFLKVRGCSKDLISRGAKYICNYLFIILRANVMRANNTAVSTTWTVRTRRSMDQAPTSEIRKDSDPSHSSWLDRVVLGVTMVLADQGDRTG